MAFVGPLCRRWECANRAERCPGYAGSDKGLTSCFLYGPRFPKRKVRMSALGHKRTLSSVRVMSALPPKADIRLHVSGRAMGIRDRPISPGSPWQNGLCRTSDRHTAPRVPGSNTHLRRGAPAASSLRLCAVLQSSAHPLGIRERCAFASSGPTIWRHCHHTQPIMLSQSRRWPSLSRGQSHRTQPRRRARKEARATDNVYFQSIFVPDGGITGGSPWQMSRNCRW